MVVLKTSKELSDMKTFLQDQRSGSETCGRVD